MEGLRDLPKILLNDCCREGPGPILAGDINASIGFTTPYDDVSFPGACGEGPRHERGDMLIAWVMQHGVQIMIRMRPRHEAQENWTHVRALDGGRAQPDFAFADIRCQLRTLFTRRFGSPMRALHVAICTR